MESIREYSNLIKHIPVYNQSAIIKKDTWERFSNTHWYDGIKTAIFDDKDSVEISRADIFSESDTGKKLLKLLLWGYPTGGRGNNIEYILVKAEELIPILSSVSGKNLTKTESNEVIEKFGSIRGLGISTWSKILYFFNVSIESRKCQIYDLKIVDSLNKKQFEELGTKKWKQDINHYYQYIELVDNLAKDLCVLPEQVELFLFYYNLYYKFTV